jgi:PAS domain S-box-containing protein
VDHPPDELESEQRLRSVAAAALVGTWSMNVTTTVVSADALVSDLFGLPGQETHRLDDYAARMVPADRPRFLEAVWRALAGESGGRAVVEFSVQLPDGASRFVEARAKADVDPQGRPLSIVGTMTDVTAREVREAARRRAEEGKEDALAVVDQELRRSQTAVGAALALLERADRQPAAAKAHRARARRAMDEAVRLLEDLLEVVATARGEPRSAPARPGPAALAQAGAPGPAAQAPPFRRRKILIVEDSETIRESLEGLFEGLGHEALLARDALEAIMQFEAGKPEVVLVDLGLPRVDGLQVARRLRARRGGERVFLIALTGYGGARMKTRARAAGFDLHLTKPIDLEALPDVIARAERPGRDDAG